MSGAFDLVLKDESVAVASTVLLGYLDVEAIGLRALSGVTSAAESTTVFTPLEFQYRAFPSPAATAVTSIPIPNLSPALTLPHAVSLVSFYAASGSSGTSTSATNVPEVSLILINSAVSQNIQPYVVEAVVRFLRCRTAGRATPLRVGIGAGIFSESLRAPRSEAMHPVFAHALMDLDLAELSKLAGQEILPISGSQRIRDPFLAAFVTALRGAGVPSAVFVVSADKPSPIASIADVEDSQRPRCAALAAALLAFATSASSSSLPSSSSAPPTSTPSVASVRAAPLSYSEAQSFDSQINIGCKWWGAQFREKDDCGGGDVMYT